MTYRDWRRALRPIVFGLAVALVALLALGVPPAAAARPNVLLIVADDLGLQLPAYGDNTIATPGIARIAEQGVVFRNAYTTQSSCSPARASLYTGTYPHQNGQLGLAGYWTMHKPYPTIPSILQANGYRTGIIGKTHIAPLSALKWNFQQMSIGWDQWRQTRDVRRVAEHARTFFQSVATGQPFFLQVSLIDPHDIFNQFLGLPEDPIDPAAITTNAYTGAPVPLAQQRSYAGYYNSVKRLDIGVGLLLDELAAANFQDDTLVVFVSDNSAGPIQGGKTDIYERGLRVPMMIRYPGVAAAGVQRPELVSLVDILPTIIAAAGIVKPDPMRVDGRSMLPLLGTAPVAGWRQTLFAEMNYHFPDDVKPSRSVRDSRYKLIHSYPPLNRGVNGYELFDLKNDRLERKNVYLTVNPTIRERLQQTLSGWQTRTNDFLPH